LTELLEDDSRIVAFKSDALTEADSQRLAELESQIRNSNESKGRALREIRDSRLYRATHRTFESYLDERWNMSKAYGYQLIKYVDDLDLSTNVDKPKSEGEARAQRAKRKKAETILKTIPVTFRSAPESPPEEMEEEERKAFLEKHGLPYRPPLHLEISGPQYPGHWVDGFANFLHGMAENLSKEEQARVLDCINTAQDFLYRYDNKLIPDYGVTTGRCLTRNPSD